MADDTRDIKSISVDSALGEMKLEEGSSPDGTHSTIVVNGKYEEHPAPYGLKRSLSATPIAGKSASQSPLKDERESQTPKSELDDDEDTIGGDITVTVEPGKVPKLSRKSTQKVPPRPPTLYNDLPDSTVESLSVFQCIPECLYGSKAMGRSKMSDDDDGPIDCDCSEERIDGENHACGEDSDCINRATKMECIDADCPCGRGCQNQRFQRKQYANVSVIKTDKKGFGLRANVDMHANDFIFEYIGEVINEPTFRKRTIQYDQEGIKHFYFMSLNKSEFIDATKKGNLGRFCNHSCNPNCYVDKWVVGQKLRMGIFAERDVKAGEELVFNYNVDRYGADPQPCYCGEANCSGYIGGKTQSGRATQLSHGTIEALGIDDGDGWDSAVSKKPRKKKANEDDEEYVNNVQPKGLDEEGVRKVMAALLQCKEKWIAVKLLDRIQRCDDDRIRLKVIQFHGYQILRTTLSQWKEDDNVILQVLDILYKFPRMSRNKIIDTKIEAPIQALVDREHEDVAFEAKRLLEEWSKLKVEYRIPRRKYDPNAASGFERRETERVEEVSKSPATPSVTAPTGPKKNIPQRNGPFPPPRPIFRRPPTNVLPAGWFIAKDEKGNQYYYSKAGQTTWVRPTFPAAAPPPPPKAPPENKNKALQDIINNILTEKPSQVATPTTSTPPVPAAQIPKKKPAEKWRSYSLEKQMKLYENTLFPHIKYVVQKFQNKLPKDDLKKFAKEVSKKLVASDYKNNRVEDPTKITDKQEKKVRAFTKDFFEKAVVKRKSIDRQKRERDARKAAAAANGHALKPDPAEKTDDDLVPKTEMKEESDAEQEISPEPEDDAEVMTVTPSSPIEVTPSTSLDPSDLKRKREPGEDTPEDDSESSKRRKEDETDLSPPPPPPPPPAGSMMPEDEMGEELDGGEVDDHDHSHSHGESMGDLGEVVMRETKEEKEMREQEEELMRENEEAMMMDLDGKLGSVDDGLYLHKTDHINGHSNGNGIGMKAEIELTEVKMKEEVAAT